MAQNHSPLIFLLSPNLAAAQEIPLWGKGGIESLERRIRTNSRGNIQEPPFITLTNGYVRESVQELSSPVEGEAAQSPSLFALTGIQVVPCVL